MTKGVQGTGSADDIELSLAKVHEERGYLLPHHGLMAVALPGMLESYDRLYHDLALTPRHLSRLDHEIVWLGVLIAVNEALGTHHIARFRDAGGDESLLPDIMSLAAWSAGASVWTFVEGAWSPHLPDFDARDDFLDGFNRARGDLPAPVAHMSAAAAHACAGHWDVLAWQITAAYECGIDEPSLAEALSLVMFPGSVPYFARTAGVWRDLIVEGKVTASEPFRRWAQLTGQGGYDEASGKVKPA